MRITATILRNLRIKFLNSRKAVFIAGFSVAINLIINVGFAFAQEPVNPSKVRTAYLYHFMQFIDWPTQVKPEGNGPYTICIPKISSEISFLEPITQKTVNDQPISIKHIDNIESLTACHILYLVDLKPHELKQYIENINGMPILSVGNSKSFLVDGCLIAFNLRKGQVTFSVNLKSANEVNLNISANMLDVAEKVIK